MTETGSTYRTAVAGTDGSESSVRAVALVVGNRGPAGLEGRLLGSLPADATRRSECDVLVVHTTG